MYLLFILLLPGLLPAQNYLMNGSPITTCSGTFYDSGGPLSNYGNNQNFNTTICSDGSGGTHVRLSFSVLTAGDVLCFYDGPSACGTFAFLCFRLSRRTTLCGAGHSDQTEVAVLQ